MFPTGNTIDYLTSNHVDHNDFIKKVNDFYMNKYDYSIVEYKNNNNM